jgi:hypothetical protein
VLTALRRRITRVGAIAAAGISVSAQSAPVSPALRCVARYYGDNGDHDTQHLLVRYDANPDMLVWLSVPVCL